VLGSGEAVFAAVSLPIAVPRGTTRLFIAALYVQASRICGSTFLPNSSNASISASGPSEPGVWKKQIDDAAADLFTSHDEE
jgi:hypothetical protein